MTKLKMMSVLGASNFRKFAFGAIAALTLGGAGQAHAQTTTFFVNNQTNGAFWATVYGGSNNTLKITWFCVLPGQGVKTSNPTYPNTVYVQAEGKASTTSCADPHDLYVSKNNPVPLSNMSNPPTITFSQTHSTVPQLAQLTQQPMVFVQE